VRPPVEGLHVQVLDGDDRLLLRNDTGAEVVVRGYDGEPYLRFAAGGGVFRNARSAASYLNEERYGGVEVPAEAAPGAAPRWERIARGRSYDWHDHRIHWMSRIDPPRVRADPGRPHHVLDWTVPLEVAGEEVALSGSLDYAPPPGGSGSPLAWAALAAAAVAAVALWLWRRRRPRAPA
jgi:hypothetical protein